VPSTITAIFITMWRRSRLCPRRGRCTMKFDNVTLFFCKAGLERHARDDKVLVLFALIDSLAACDAGHRLLVEDAKVHLDSLLEFGNDDCGRAA